MSIIETVWRSLFLLLMLSALGLGLAVVYRTIRQPVSGDRAASQQVKALVEQGRSYLRKGKLAQAISTCEAAMELDPNNAQVYLMCGLARAGQGDHHAALADYNRAIELDPGDAGIYVNRGMAHQKLGNMELALADFDQAVTLNPDDSIVRLSRLKLLQSLGNIEKALADLKHVMKTSPELAERESTKTLLAELQEPRG